MVSLSGWLVGWLVSNEDVTIDGLQKGFKAFEQGEIFIVPHQSHFLGGRGKGNVIFCGDTEN